MLWFIVTLPLLCLASKLMIFLSIIIILFYFLSFLALIALFGFMIDFSSFTSIFSSEFVICGLRWMTGVASLDFLELLPDVIILIELLGSRRSSNS